MHSPLISAHIEKTAGTSLLAAFERRYGADHVVRYQSVTEEFVRLSDDKLRRTKQSIDLLKDALNHHPKLLATIGDIRTALMRSQTETDTLKPSSQKHCIPPEIEVIHGHFPADHFDNVYADPRVIMVFRNPLNRLVSQFLHWQRTKGRVAFELHIPFDPNLDFESYALLEANANLQARRLNGKPLDSLHAIGVAEKLGDFLQKLQFPADRQSHLNKSPRGASVQLRTRLKRSFIGKFAEVHAEDYTLYRHAWQQST
jgi:hypothetical protein